MRILTVVYDLDIGGTQRAAVTFANAYERLGHESRILVTKGRGSREGDVDDGVPIIGPVSHVPQFDDWVPDLVHLHSHGLDESLVRRLQGTGAGSASWVEQNVFAHPTPWTDLVDCTFLFSRWCENQYAVAPGPHAGSARVPNSIDSTRFFPDPTAGSRTRERLGIPLNAIVMGRIGQRQTYKWSPLVIEAFNAWADGESRAWLLLVGAPSDVSQRAEDSPHRDRIVLVDRVTGDDELRAHYSAMDFFGHAALQGETFGYVLVEAMLCEVPVITLSTPWADNSQGEVVGHRVGGLVATTASGFAGAVKELATDANLRSSLGSAGRDRVLETYESIAVAQSALELMQAPRPAEPLERSELLAAYSVAVDPPTGALRLAAGRGMWPTVAWLSGARSLAWLGQTTLNRWGISRHGISRPGAKAT
jgi:glycosyltransferase involved in cell wall biosynthesis